MRELDEIKRANLDRHRLCDFISFLPTGQYIHKPSGAFWPAKTVNAVLPPQGEEKPIAATRRLDQHASVVQMARIPGEEDIIDNVIVIDGGMIDCLGQRVFNTYRPPTLGPGIRQKASPWLKHVTNRYKIYDRSKLFAASPPEVIRCDESTNPNRRCSIAAT